MSKRFSKVWVLYLVVALAAVTATQALAASIWMSVDPGYQAVRWTDPRASWATYTGKEPGCPETNLKNRVYYGDGTRQTKYAIIACQGYLWAHTFPGPVEKHFYQSWYAGQGSGSWIYMVQTDVYEYQPH